MKKLAFLFLVFLSTYGSVLAQNPKLDLKMYGGVHGQKFIYREDIISEEYYPGWQGGFGFRVSYRKIFGEFDIEFIRSNVTVNLSDSLGTETEFFNLKLNSINIPLKVGYIPVKTPFFKWYVYGGLANRINTRAIITLEDETFKFKPGEVTLKVYNLDFIVGTQVDIGWANIDFYYGTGITNSIRSGIRTNHHQLLINLGFLF